MQKLAKREEQIMQAIWKLQKAFVKEIIEELPDPKPHYNSVSTMVRILEDKGFVSHEAFGKTHRYYPLISKEEYQKTAVGELLGKYFDNSPSKMVAYFAEKESISEDELKEILKMIQKGQ
jgi:predicted transcriptional regulator